MAPPMGRRWSWRERLFDIAPALVLLVAGALDIAFRLSEPVGSAPVSTAVVPVVIACLALLGRRRWPVVVLGIVLLAIVMPALSGAVSLSYWGEFLPWLVALYSSARHDSGRMPSLIAFGMSAVALAALAVVFPEMGNPADLLYNSLLLLASWLLGLFARSWGLFRERNLRLEFEREQAEERARRAERARIARELHDVIAHTITVVVMQAGGARMAAASDPGAAGRALAEIESLGRSSLAELRMLLTVLGPDDADAPATAPQPTLDHLDELCERTRDLGLPVSLTRHGDVGDLPLGVQLTAYRVVQEALTNAIKHGGSRATRVCVDRSGRPGSLTVEVVSSGEPVTATMPGAARGLVGLEERIRLFDGTLIAGPRDDGTFGVKATLPLREDRA